MAAIYVREQGAVITRQGEQLIVTRRGSTLLKQPMAAIDSLSVFGSVQISTPAVTMLLEKGIDVSYFSYGGKFIGHMGADHSKNIFIRMIQHQIYADQERRLSLARTIVRNKILNQIAVTSAYRGEASEEIRLNNQEMARILKKLPSKEDTQSIMGIEGLCSNIYFQSFGKMIRSDLTFTKRSRRPPRDPVNIILSLAYTLLTREVESALETEALETYLGFLHGVRYGRRSLALDIVEEFRQPVVDRLTLKLFNKRILTEYEFLSEDGEIPTLSEDGFRKFCISYEKWLSGRDPDSGEKSFRSCIHRQAALLKTSIRDHKDYMPYSWSDRRTCT